MTGFQSAPILLTYFDSSSVSKLLCKIFRYLINNYHLQMRLVMRSVGSVCVRLCVCPVRALTLTLAYKFNFVFFCSGIP